MSPREEIPSPGEYRIVEIAKKSELEQLASWFHQDWSFTASEVNERAAEFIAQRTPSQRALLRSQLVALATECAGRSRPEIRSAWMALGAEAWPPEVDLLQALETFASKI